MLATKSLIAVISLSFCFGITFEFEVTQFRPVTDGINFRANYRIQTFVDGRPVSTSDVYESYHFTLATGLIRQTILEENRSGEAPVKTTSKYLYDSHARRLVEIGRDWGDKSVDDSNELFHDDFYLPENGCTNSYQSYTYSRQAVEDQLNNCNEYFNSARVLPQATRLESRLLLAGTADSSLSPLDLDQFMTSDCLARVESNLHYIQGVSRLLHLIECRRKEFKLERTPASPTRSLASRRYRATPLKPITTAPNEKAGSSVELDISIAVEELDHAGEFDLTLKSGTIPLSISVSFAPGLTILINVFQFEAMGPDEHLSESSSSHSIYMMPLAHPELNVALGTIQRTNRSNDVFDQKVGKSFSFKGLLTGNLFSKFYSDPIEVSMSYDAELRSLASETSFIDRSNSDGLDGWKRSIVSQLLDGQSSLKFHLMERNFGYRYLSSSGAANDDSNVLESNWRPCATNHLSSSESKLLLDERSDLLNLGKAIYMGMALVRGIQCHVFEKRLFRLPVWFNLDTRTYDAFLENRGIYLDVYVYYNQIDEPILTRLHLRVLKQDRETLSWVLDLNSFSWSAEDFLSDGSLSHQTLAERMTQHCLLLESGARHLGVELWFKRGGIEASSSSNNGSTSSQTTNRDEAKLRSELQASAKLRNQALVEMLARSLKISPVQQVELVSEVSTPVGAQSSASGNWLLYVKFNLYELWNDSVEEEIIGFALDQSFNTRLQAKAGTLYAQGARSYSYEECKWRAIHSLRRPGVTSEYNRRDNDEAAEFLNNNLRLFMFCPERLICHLGDSKWLPLRRKRPLKLENLLEFPYDKRDSEQTSDINKCLVSSVIIRQQSILSKSSGLQSCRSKLEWWLESGRHGSGGRPEPDDESDDDGDALARLRLRELKYELKVRRTGGGEPNRLRPAGGNHAADQTATGRSLLMEASKLRLSNRVLISNANLDNGAGEQLATSSLTKPLAGLAYRGSAQKPAGSTVGGASSNTGHIDMPTKTSRQSSTEPVVVLSLAECSRLCLLMHACRSFSACHQPLNTWLLNHSAGGGSDSDRVRNSTSAGRISCIFSKISWANPEQVNKLMRLARRGSTSKQAAASAFMEVDVNEATSAARVEFELSPLCSLHARPQMSLFRLRRSHSEVQPKVDYLIYARSAEQCARFCQERAELVRQLERRSGAAAPSGPGMSGAARWAACHEFYFSADNHYCKLAPTANHWKLLKLDHLIVRSGHAAGQQATAPANETDSGELLGRWRDWFQRKTPVESWLRRIASVFGESEYYELDFRQIFLVHRNHRLTFTGAAETRLETEMAAGQLQIQLGTESRLACAEFCLRRKGCRSFSLKLSGRKNSSSCLLNGVAARDLPELANGRSSSALAAAFKFERVAAASNESGQDVWWHYEPSELASFMMLDPDEWQPPETKAAAAAANMLHTTSGDDSDPFNLFVRPEPSLFYDGTLA